MTLLRYLWVPVLACAGIAGPVLSEEPAAISPAQERFFEEKVRPVLATSCHECHGAKKQESGLRLDSRQAVLEGGDSGEKALVPGEPQRSLLVKAINHAGDYHMPPNRKLTSEQIAALTEWVKDGAPWPASAAPAVEHKLSSVELAPLHRQSHWAYQPVARPPLPAVSNAAWLQYGTDAFILARLDNAKLTPSPEADRRTLIRRLSFDLSGLPPTPDEVEDFAADLAPDAYERLVDRLLASPRFGERWGRHWLDLARYADTEGYAFQQERRFPYAYTYRDYVIRSLNADLPYDQFLVEQLAADRLPPAEDKSSLAALGFLTTGRKFNNRNDDIDDQIDVVARGMLGITVACARCHDHKYDAIPTADYYSLYGVFASCSEPAPAELPLIAPPEQSAEYQKFEGELAKVRADVDKFSAEKYAELLDQTRRQAADYLASVAAGESQSLLAKLPYLSLEPKDLRPRLTDRWRRYLEEQAKPEHAALGLWNEMLKLPSESFTAAAQPVLAKWQALPAGTAAGQCNPVIQQAFAADVPATKLDVPRIYGRLLTDAYALWQAAGGNAGALAKLPTEQRQLAEILVGPGAPTDIERGELRQYLSRADRNKFQELQKKVESFQAASPLAPPRAMVVADKPRPEEPRILIRGQPTRPGERVPRQFLLVLSEKERTPFVDGSGRLELARAIVSPANPLTRRVIANRLWMHHFGEPLALSPSDFGIRSDPPSHPELLDDLAIRLLDSGWSLKSLHREIACSATYRQASNDRPECRAVDSENRLLWRMNRRRLELEAMRDTLLAGADQLDTRMHGRPVELTKSPFTHRRAVYGFIDRQDLPNLFRVFDIASPDQSSPRRPRTTVPQQALFLMNSPFVVEQAQALAARPEVAAAADDSARVASLYRLVLHRAPDSDELATCRDFLLAGQSQPDAKLPPLAQLAQLLLLTNEVMYID